MCFILKMLHSQQKIGNTADQTSELLRLHKNVCFHGLSVCSGATSCSRLRKTKKHGILDLFQEFQGVITFPRCSYKSQNIVFKLYFPKSPCSSTIQVSHHMSCMKKLLCLCELDWLRPHRHFWEEVEVRPLVALCARAELIGCGWVIGSSCLDGDWLNQWWQATGFDFWLAGWYRNRPGSFFTSGASVQTSLPQNLQKKNSASFDPLKKITFILF